MPPLGDKDPFRFYCKCTALGKEVLGFGITKRNAKHKAAQLLLEKHARNSDLDDDDDLKSTPIVDRNAITDLLDMCAQRNFPKPDFKEICTVGPPHAPTFTIECCLSSIKRSASAPSKKVAKQLAAIQVLEVVKSVIRKFINNFKCS